MGNVPRHSRSRTSHGSPSTHAHIVKTRETHENNAFEVSTLAHEEPQKQQSVDAVWSEQNVGDRAIGPTKIQLDSITTEHLRAGSVTTEKLNLVDAYGSTILTSVGFGEAWSRFVGQGLFNGDFGFPSPDTGSDIVADINDLPWWSIDNVLGTAIGARSVADAGTGSGWVLRFTMSAGAAGDELRFLQVIPVRASHGRAGVFRFETAVKSTSTGLGEAGLAVQYLKEDGSDTGSLHANLRTMDQIDADADIALISVTTDAAPPADAWYALIGLIVRRGSAATSYTCTVDFCEVSVTFHPSGIVFPDTVDPTKQPGGIAQQDGNAFWLPSGIVDAANEPFISLSTQRALITGLTRFGYSSNWPDATPANADQFFRNDFKQWFFYDGARWLSTGTYEMPICIITNLAATDTDAYRVPVPSLQGCTDIWLEYIDWVGFQVSGGTALSASHKWAVDVDFIPINGGTIDTHGAYTIDSGSSSIWRKGNRVLVGALMDGGAAEKKVFTTVTATKTGTPGNLYIYATLTYRLTLT